MTNLPWNSPRVFLEAWTATEYEGIYPPYLNVTQVGSMLEITLRGPIKLDGAMGDSITIKVNVWTANKISDVLKAATNKFECELEERLFEEHLAKTKNAKHEGLVAEPNTTAPQAGTEPATKPEQSPEPASAAALCPIHGSAWCSCPVVKDQDVRYIIAPNPLSNSNTAASQALRNTTGQAETPPTTPVDAAVPIVNEHLLSDLKENYEHDREAARLEGMEEAAKIADAHYFSGNLPGLIRAEITKRKEKS